MFIQRIVEREDELLNNSPFLVKGDENGNRVVASLAILRVKVPVLSKSSNWRDQFPYLSSISGEGGGLTLNNISCMFQI